MATEEISQASAASGSEADRQFEQLCRDYYRAWFRYHPERAVDAGVYEHAGCLRSYEHDDIGALIVLNQKMLSALDELSFGSLQASRQSDYRLLKGSIQIELHDLEDNDWRYRDPLAYVPVSAIYQLLIHPGTGVPQAIKQRLQSIPDYLRGARLMLSRHPERVVPEWTQTAATICREGANFIRDLPRQPQIHQIYTHPERLQPVFDAAAHALQDFAAYLEDELLPQAKGKFASGSNRFERLLHERHFLPPQVDADTILAFGEKLAADTEAELLAASEKLCGRADITVALKTVQATAPAASDLLPAYRRSMQQAQQWLQQSALLSLPEESSLKVLPTPAFLRSLIPFAAYEPPAPNDAEQVGLYYVTETTQAEQLLEHNETAMALTSVHEAWPGHHCQFVLANQDHRDNPNRLLNISASLYEGWALYCEQLVVEQGLYNKDEHRFVLLRDRLWRALRVIIDVAIHTGRMSLGEAAQLLVDRLHFEPQQARAEVNWYSHAATTPLCYALGREMILQCREIIDVDVGNREQLCEFHDKLLSQGSIALPLVIAQVFGEEVLEQVMERVFIRK